MPLYAHHSGVLDAIAVSQHPEWAASDGKGNPDKMATSVFGEYADKRLIPQLIEIAKDYGLNGAWIDGECWGAVLEHSDAAVKAYREKTGKDAFAPENKSDYVKFYRQGFRDYVKHYIEQVKKVVPDFEIASNWLYSSQVPEKATLPVDFISGDLAPTNSVNSARLETRIMQTQGKPWDLMAWGFSYPVLYLKGVEQLKQEAAMVISHGGGFQIFERQSALNTIEDESVINDLTEVSAFCKARKDYCFRCESANDVGVLYSTSAYYKANGDRLFGNNGAYNEDLQGVLFNLLDNGVATDIVLSQNVKDDTFSTYKVLFLSNCLCIEENVKKNLSDFVFDGGTLVLTGSDTACLFADDFGYVVSDKKSSESSVRLHADGKSIYYCGDYVELLSGIKTLERMSLNDYDLTKSRFLPEIAEVRRGKGRILILPFDFGKAYFKGKSYQLSMIALKCLSEYTPKVKVENSGFVEVNVTRKDGKEYVHLINISGSHESEYVKTFNGIPILKDISVSYRADRKINKVILFPKNKQLKFETCGGAIKFSVDKLEIMATIRFD